MKSPSPSGSHFDTIRLALAKIRKFYRLSKLLESNHAKKSQIKSAIDKRIESFELNKDHTVRSVLEQLFHKVVLDYLVVGDELVLDPAPVKSKVDEIMEGYVFDKAFSGVMGLIDSDELFGVVFNLLNGKAAGLSACSTYNVLRGDNFSVLKGMTTQSPIFAVGSVVEDALEKTRELWLVLQDMRKAYNSVGWEHLEKCLVRIKMCNRFIQFFGGIHKGCINRVMTDFGLTDSYWVHDGLDQGESGRVKLQAGLSSCFTAGAFVDNTIWVGSSQSATQHILDVTSKFFQINDISINNDKTVAIPINCRVENPVLFISDSPISVAKKGESHQYLGIFLLTEGLSKPSLAKIQSEGKIASFINFANSGGIVGRLFFHKSYNLQKKLDPYGPTPEWFRLSAVFLVSEDSSPAHTPVLANVGPLDILGSSGFVSICDHLLRVNTKVLSVYTDGSLRNLGTVGCKAGAAAFFEDIGMGLGVGVSGLMLSTMAELQAIALALECVPVFSNVHLFSDSQSVLDCQHIANIISSKVLNVTWYKVKGHFGVLGNKHVDVIAGADFVSDWFLSYRLNEHFLMADGNVVSGNSRHFVHDTFHAMCYACWETDVDWSCSSLVWHPDLHMAASFTSRILANARSYFMKALYHWLPVAVRKWLYNRLYPSVLCLYCSNVEVSDYVFSCEVDDSAQRQLLDSHMNTWKTLFGSSVSSSCLLQLLSSCVSGSSVSMALHKSFVFDNWFCEAVSIFHSPKAACLKVINFAHSLGFTFRDEIWLVRAKHHVYMEKHGLIPLDGSSSTLVSGLTSCLFVGVVDLLGINKAFGVYFGFRRSCMFFSSIGNSVSVYIAA
ncbi:hypothetical protein G9A89_001931 [Geosiphon pyriformis]|nr:hypothetical protein G9A89_001931 [Geosiphon pyriformis]